MKKLLLGSLAFAVLGIAPALAADIPLKARAAPAAVAAYNWSGFYLGANAGYSWGRSDVDYICCGGTALTAAVQLRPEGFIGGGQIGYNWQSGAFVFGLEVDAAYRRASASATHAFANGIDFADRDTEQGWLATLRPRVGLAANNFLFFGTGGLAVAGLKHSFTERRPATAGATRTISDDRSRAGWTVGGGVEAGFGQLSLGVEYLYVDLGTTTLSAPAATLGGVAFGASSVSFRDRSHIVRGKLNWHFGGPVVARY